jgi:BirA family biotin operon repressor/biotin-[acetyl-CoA-carboxylase] ligase
VPRVGDGHDGLVYSDLRRPPLSLDALRHAVVVPGSVWSDVRIVDRTGSTNADLAAAALTGAPEGTVLVAESQDGGRGRLGRPWTSPPRAGLTFSVLLRPEAPPGLWSWLPLLAGVAVARAIGRLGEVPARLKWPNDVLLGPERRKVAGILAEISGGAVVIGVGLNVTTRRDELPREDATSLVLEAAARADRQSVLHAVLRELGADYQSWQAAVGETEGSGLRAAYIDSCDTLGRHVRVALPGDAVIAGRAVDVDVGGRLVIEAEDGTRTPVAAGDVVHVR